MYVWTTDNKILNLDHYARVDVVEHRANDYSLSAFDTPKPKFDDPVGITIAKFNNEADAKYSRCLLFNALMSKAGAWDASAIPLISDVWEEVKAHFSSDTNIRWGLLEKAEISVTGLDEMTITYSSECENQLGSNINNYKKTVSKKLSEVLGVDIKWKSSDEIE